MSFKNTDMEITTVFSWKQQLYQKVWHKKNAHKKDTWHSCDIRRRVAHNYDKNLCEKNYEKKLIWQKQIYVKGVAYVETTEAAASVKNICQKKYKDN